MGGIFVNYRTGDGDWAATLIARELTTRFGADNVFFASRSIRLGEDFAERIMAGLLRSDVLLAVIGHRWATLTGPDGRPRVDDPEDWVHREIAESFKHDIRVVPVFLDGRGRLSEADLPVAISRLARCQYLRLHHRNDDHDITRLLDELTTLLPGPAAPAPAEPRPLGDCPYRGLQPFREQDAQHFHGRDRELARLSQLVEHRDTVLVAGASGSGKSSLVRAGLWPRLRAEGTELAVFRPIAGIPPRQLLAAALKPVLGPGWAERLADTEPELLAGDIAAETGGLVLCADQFEELAAADPAAASDLFDLLTRFVRAAPRAPGVPPELRLVCTVRSAQLDHLRSPALTEALEEAAVHLRPMTAEQLHAAITRPAELAGAAFEPGLPERIIADAADSPGQLPLVEFTLTRLWETGALTHAAYDELGGVAGALAGYAEEVYAQRLPADSRTATEGLLTQLARPAPDGEFRLSPARLDHLNPAQQALAVELAAARLVVIRQDVDQPEIVALVHETLVRTWPRLRDWLLAAADFRAWQEHLRTDLIQWESAQRDPGGLLRGVALATAEQWLADNPERLTAGEREYITGSRAHERRGLRRLRVITAVAVTMALVAGVLTVLVQQRGSELADRLQHANAALLAQWARRAADLEPISAVQAAQAAWRVQPGNDEAYGALLEQYLSWQHLDRLHPPIPGLAPKDLRSSADGRVLAVRDANDARKIVVWPEGDPAKPWEVRTDPVRDYRISPDGKTLVVATQDGAIALWQIAERSGPVPLRPPGNHTTLLRVSADSGILAVLDGSTDQPRALHLWDLRTRRPLPAPRFNPGVITDLAPLPGGENVLTAQGKFPATPTVSVRELRSGAVVRTNPGGALLGNGTVVASCEDGILRLRATASGELRDPAMSVSCKDLQLGTDASGEILLLSEHSSPNLTGPMAADRHDLLHWRSGHFGRLHAPMLGSDAGTPTFAARQEPDGSRMLLATLRGVIGQVRLPPSTGPVTTRSGRRMTWDTKIRPGGRSYVRVVKQPAGDVLISADAATGAVLGERPETVGSFGLPEFTPDGTRTLLPDTTALHVLDGGDLRPQRAIPLPERPAGMSSSRPTVAVLSDEEAVVLHNGQLSRWRLGTGERVGDPLPVATNPEQLRRYARSGYLLARPGHPEQLVIGAENSVEVWDLRERRKVREIPTGPGSVALDPTGTRMVVRGVVWDLDRGTEAATLNAPMATVLGFAGPLLLTAIGYKVQAWRWEKSELVAEIRLHPQAAQIEGDQLRYFEPGDTTVQTLSLNPDQWFRKLCQVNDREFTEREKFALPEGAGTGRPCAG